MHSFCLFFKIGWSEIISETEITAMGFFALSKSSMISAFSTILGYLIILVQFKVAEQQNSLISLSIIGGYEQNVTEWRMEEKP